MKSYSILVSLALALFICGTSSCSNGSEENVSNRDSEQVSPLVSEETPEKKNTTTVIGNLEIAAEDYKEKLDWYPAYQACKNLGDGWRLPTLEELHLMYDNREKIGGFDPYGGYWSSEHDEWNATLISFHDGLEYSYVQGNYNYAFRPVRTIK